MNPHITVTVSLIIRMWLTLSLIPPALLPNPHPQIILKQSPEGHLISLRILYAKLPKGVLHHSSLHMGYTSAEI